jgi:hypothetical protein
MVEITRKDAGRGLDGVGSGFASPYSDGFFYIGHEYLAIANSPGLGCAPDSVNRFFQHIVAEYDFNFNFGEKIDHIFGTPIKFGMPFLAAKTLGLSDSDALQADFLQSFLHFVELERLDNGLDFFHCFFLAPLAAARIRRTALAVSRTRAKPEKV